MYTLINHDTAPSDEKGVTIIPQRNPTRASSRQAEPPGGTIQTLVLALLLGLALSHALPPAFAEAPPAGPRFLWQAVDATTDTTAVYTLTTNGSQVFIGEAGLHRDPTAPWPTITWLITAYDAATGATLWRDELYPPPSTIALAKAITTTNDLVIVVGASSNTSYAYIWLVRAYDAATGTLRWQDTIDQGPRSAFASAIAIVPTAAGPRIVVAGTGTGGDGIPIWLVRVYAAAGGILLTTAIHPLPGTITAQPTAIAVEGTRVFITGTATDKAGTIRVVTRAYTVQ